MRTHLQFRSAQLRDPKGVGNSINADIRGRMLADFLSAQFEKRGYDGGVGEEDWGWMIELAFEPVHLWLGCSSYAEPDDPDPQDWLVFIEPSKPFVRKLFKKIDAQPAVAAAADLLEQVVVAEGGASDLRWWSDHESGRR